MTLCLSAPPRDRRSRGGTIYGGAQNARKPESRRIRKELYMTDHYQIVVLGAPRRIYRGPWRRKVPKPLLSKNITWAKCVSLRLYSFKALLASAN
jgi:hypothetical protein